MIEKILITGSNGMLGSSLKRIIPKDNFIPIDFPNDLRDIEIVRKCFKKYHPTHVIHTAAKVGGVKANMNFLGDFFTDNIKINSNILEVAKEFNVKVLSLLSTCIYPDKVSYPLTEDQIHNGPPHSSNYAYAYTKRMLDIQSQAYRDQFGCNFITIVPNNLFGIEDNFDLENSHVIPAMIRKIYEAKLNNKDVVLWGDGSPLREFTFVDDLAKIILFLLYNYNEREPINVGNTQEYTIKYVAEQIMKNFNFSGKLIWDTNMPMGQYRKPSSNEKFLKLNSFVYTTLEDGLKKVCQWFEKNYPNVRGIK